MTPRRSAKRKPRAKKSATVAKPAVSLKAIVAAGLLRPPIRLWSEYLGHSLSATIEADGAILFQDVRCASPSTAARLARKPFDEGSIEGARPPATNGWTFWQVQDPASNEMVPLDVLRERYRQRKKAASERSRGGGA